MNLEGYSDQFIDYYNYYKKYKDIYGDNTVVLYQNGSFFEIYSYQKEDNTFLGNDIYQLGDLINISITRKDKSKPLSKSNILMAGIPTHKKTKYASLLLNENYHVIIVEQITAPPKPTRDVTEILSPGIKISEYDDNQNIDNILMSVFIEKSVLNKRDIFSAGISLMNVSTGKNYFTNVITSYEDNDFTFNEIKRYISYYNPVEVLFHTRDFSMTKDEIIKKFDLMNINVYLNFFTDKSFLQKKYQNELLQKIFKFNSQYSPIEKLNLELKEEVLLSYIYLLNYIYGHKNTLIDNIDIPESIEDSKYLVLSNDSVRQLNVCDNYSFYKGSNKDLLSLLNKCVSIIGKRTYKNRLLYPCIDESIINKRYNTIDILINQDLYNSIRNNFNKINDYEKSIRNMGLNLYNTITFYSDYISYEYIINNIDIVENSNDLKNEYTTYTKTFSKFKEYHSVIKNTFEFDNFSCYLGCNDIQKPIFKKGLYDDIDLLDENIKNCLNNYEFIIKTLSKIIDSKKNTDLVKLDFTDKFNWFLQCTNTRSKNITKYLNNKNIKVKDNEGKLICEFTKDNLSFKKRDNTNNFIICDYLTNLSKDLIEYNKELTKLNKKYYETKIKELYLKYVDDLKDLNKFIGDLDCNSNNAYVSIKNNYFKPNIVDSDKSFVDIKDLRHPIAEQINKSKEFIKNDIHLGKSNQSGILLYGLNSSGKSTTSKAIALSLIMAQCGSYVPAKEFHYKPYKQIFTRILNNDKLWAGQSSFAVECKEINHILRNASKDSFVIGDEIFSSTESDSAISLVNGVIQMLHKIDCSYIFATHFHELMNLQDIKKLINENLKIYHLTVRNENGVLFFDRILKEGNGPTDYGIMVGKSLGLPDELINIANNTKKILNNVSENIISEKTSKYNANVIMDMCKMPGCKNKACETHHIKEQHTSDKNGNIGDIHQNDQHNLCPLCKEHHDQITYGNLVIKGYLDTSEGLKLDYEYTDKKKNKKKFDNKDISIIKEYYDNNKNILSKKDIISKLLSERKIEISSQTFSRVINNIY